jgi:prepilin-type N-terminal cleavage/methylation domain-containing protein
MKSVGDASGFSIIELVITLVIVGIVAAIAGSRMLNSDAYNIIAAREQIVSSLRMAQQRAIGHEDVVLTLQPSGNNLTISLAAGAVALMSPVSTPLAGVSVRADLDTLNSCSTPPAADNELTALKPLHVAYDALGDLRNSGVVDGTPGYPAPVSTGLRICLNNDPAMSICVSAVGFAYVGDCDE